MPIRFGRPKLKMLRCETIQVNSRPINPPPAGTVELYRSSEHS